MKILRIVLSILMILCSANTQQLPSISAYSRYCNIKTLTTPQLLLNIIKDQSQPIDRSIFKIRKTQNYEKDSTTINLGYVESQGDLMIEQTSAKLISQIYTEDIENQLVYVDGRDGYIIALELLNKTAYKYNYVLLKADIKNGSNTKMNTQKLVKKHNEELNSSNNENQQIMEQQLKIDILKILSIEETQIYLLVKQGTQQQQALYKIDLIESQVITEGEKIKQLTFVANINEPNRTVNLIGGNIYHLYDKNSMRFYQLQIDPITKQHLYTQKMLSQLNIDSLMNLDTLQFVSLQNGFEIMVSYLNGETIMIPLTQDAIKPQQAIRMIGKPKFYTDNWKNCLIVTDNDFLWIRTQPKNNNKWTQKLFSTTLSITQRDQLQAIMSNAQYISFDGHYAMVVSQNIGNRQGSLNSVFYDTQKAPYFYIVDRLKNSIDLNQLKFSSLLANNLISNILSETYLTSFKCNCVSLEVERFECFLVL